MTISRRIFPSSDSNFPQACIGPAAVLLQQRRYALAEAQPCQDLPTIVADDLENLLDLLDEAGMEDRLRELDVAEVPRALAHALLAGRTLVLSIDGTEAWVVETALTRLRPCLVHRLGVYDVSHAHILDLLG